MENMNENTTGSRKKFLAPLVVLLLCAVSLTGAAYAYNTTFDVVNNQVTSEEYVLQVYGDNTTTTVISDAFSVDALRVYTATEVGADPNTVKVKAEAHTQANVNPFTGRLTLKDSTLGTEMAVRAVSFTYEFVEGGVGETIDGVIDSDEVGAVDGSVGYELTLELFTDSSFAPEKAYTTATQIQFTEGVAELYYRVTISATDDSEEGILFHNNTPQADVNLVTTQLAKEKFVLKFSAASA